MTSMYFPQSQSVGPLCSKIEKAFGAVMGVLAHLSFSQGSPIIQDHRGLSPSLACVSGVRLCLWEWRVFTWGEVFADSGEGSVGQRDFLVLIGEPVRNPSGECQVDAQTAADPLVYSPGSLACLHRRGRCLLCGCLLPG